MSRMLIHALVVALSGATVVSAVDCTSAVQGGPIQVTADCIDPLYRDAIIDNEASFKTPAPHYKVSGHFNGTQVRFNYYFPPKPNWQNRFFQLVYPLQTEDADDLTINFCAKSGAYAIQVTGTQGYRADAAAAKFSRSVARDYYGFNSQKIFGYVYGGSGGSYQTVGGIENTEGVWDGAVPIVQAVSVSIPNNLGARAMGGLVLSAKSASISDAVSPGGTGNPYVSLNPTERSVLLEVTRMGIPLSAWEAFATVADTNTLRALTNIVKGLDPTYAVDFWTKSGYLGTEQSSLGDIFRRARVDYNTTITAVQLDAEKNAHQFHLG